MTRGASTMDRRRFLALGASTLLGAILSRVGAQPTLRTNLRIGTVLPVPSGEGIVRASINDIAGAAARMGSILGFERIGDEAERLGVRMDVLFASAPTEEAAVRAGRRLVATEGIHALVGGIGEGQAETLAAIAEEAGVLFFNIGSSSDALRRDACRRTTFHVEASAAMYLDAIVLGAARDAPRRWFVVAEADTDGERLLDRAREAVDRHGGGDVVGTAAVAPGQPVYYAELERARAADADTLLVLVGDLDQFALVGQADSLGLDLEVFTYPGVITQTRDYIASSRIMTPRLFPRRRTALWETTLDAGRADELNDRYVSRWGEPMDPTAWAAYSSIRILYEAHLATGSTDADVLIEYLESPEAVFDLHKGPGTSFRPWDHQLRQPLYVVDVREDVPWQDLVLASRIGIVGDPEIVPASATGGAADLDLLGDGPERSTCRF